MNTEEKNDKSGYLSTQTHIHSLIHTIKLYVYTHTHTHTHMDIQTRTHTHTHTRTHTHTHTHTPIHTPTHKERNNYTICSDNDCNVDNTDAKVLYHNHEYNEKGSGGHRFWKCKTHSQIGPIMALLICIIKQSIGIINLHNQTIYFHLWII